MAPISITFEVQQPGVVEYRDPSLRVGQIVRVTVEVNPTTPSPEELAARVRALRARIQARPEMAVVTDEDIREAIKDARREMRETR